LSREGVGAKATVAAAPLLVDASERDVRLLLITKQIKPNLRRRQAPIFADQHKWRARCDADAKRYRKKLVQYLREFLQFCQ
jgi:hypothetical protein